MDLSHRQGYHNKSLRKNFDNDEVDQPKPADEDKLTQYFEDLAAKALDLTKKYNLKEEFDMIKGEIKKHEVIKQSQHSPGHAEFDHYDSSSEESGNSLERAKQRKKKLLRMKNYQRPRKTARPETPEYIRKNKRKLVLKKGDIARHERLYALAAKNRIQKDYRIAERSTPALVTQKLYPHIIRQYELSKKLNLERKYISKREEEIEDQIECTFQPEIARTQNTVRGRRNGPIFAPMLTEEQIYEKKQERIQNEMYGCTFRPELNEKSLKIADRVIKKKQEEEQREVQVKPDIIPLKQLGNDKKTNKASMFFDVHSHKAHERLAKEKLKIHSRHNTNSSNNDIFNKKVVQNQTTPEFEEIQEKEPEVPMLPTRDDNESEEDEDIDRMIKQVIFDNEFYK
ncbi:unnamed protein product [Moneuplotes crassus]|uniref:Uncharacterized protein n=1 Tax=Euplotes crassus TaxID=5936 RepID=A0AAD1XCY2_EUPCR|nr:unnamed protein product [Moneuplotes crassus]